MDYNKRLENVAVIGAAGKMGSGIAALIGQEMAKLKLNPENKDKIYRLNLIDISEGALDGLAEYLKKMNTKGAEKSIGALRDIFKERADLVENTDIINEFVGNVAAITRFGTSLKLAKDANVVFEAIVEDHDTKIKVYKALNELCADDTYFLTNTSSIPISVIDKDAGLGGRIIGYHFYNPPVVQRLVEVINAESTKPDLNEFAGGLGKALRKKLIPANDVAGFIGNGHFTRDGLFALAKADELKGEYTLPGALYIMNRVSQDFLIRPMGIFQLIDYVGIDVFQCILNVMREHLDDKNLKSELVDRFAKKGVLGGQRADGSQKDGFLKYEKNRPVGVYDIEKGEYSMFEGLKGKLDGKIGTPPEGHAPWRALLMDGKKDNKLAAYFGNLKDAEGLGADLARQYMKTTKEIGQGLIDQGIAKSADDVNAVLTNGFYWLYGPINDYLK